MQNKPTSRKKYRSVGYSSCVPYRCAIFYNSGLLSKGYDVLNEEIEKLNQIVLKANKKISKLENDLILEKKRREVKEIELDEYREKNRKLLAECQRLQNQLHLK